MSLKDIEKRDYRVLKIPKTLQDNIPISSITEDGIARLERGRYSATFELRDIDYFSLDEEDQEKIFFKYEDILNSLSGTKATYKLSFFKGNKDRKETARRKMLDAHIGDGYDYMRQAYNELRAMDIEGSSKELYKYLTVSVPKTDIEKAGTFFKRLNQDLGKKLAKIKSGITMLDADERLRILHNFYNSGHENMYVPYSMATDKDLKSKICPESIVYHSDHFTMGSRFGRVLLLRTWSKSLRDDFMRDIGDIDTPLVATMDIISLSMGEINKLLEDKDSDVEASIINWSNGRNARKNRAAVLPRRLKKGRKVLDEYTEDIQERDQRVFLCQLTIVITADSRDKLDEFTDTLFELAGDHNCSIGIMYFMQYEGLINALPYGLRTIQALRDCTTDTAAAMMPFNAQKLQHDTGIPYGRHLATEEQVFIDRRLLPNGNEIILGESGGGKSQNAKLKIAYETFVTNGYIILIDPDGEYAKLVQALGGTFIRIGRDNINAFDMAEGYGFTDNAVKEKSNFITSLCERIIDNREAFGEVERSIIDRCVISLYEYYGAYPEGITLMDFYNVLKVQPEKQAEKLALSLERHIIGSFNAFAKPTSVNLDSRIQCFDLSGLDSQFKSAGMMVCLDCISNILAKNRYKGVATYINIDELDEFLKHPASSKEVEKFFQRARKYGGFTRAMIQDIEKMLDIPQARTMLHNSANVIMMNQSPDNARKLAALYGLSEQDRNFLIDAEPGFGINKIGKNVFQFDGTIPKTNALYQFVNTDGHSITS